MTESNCTCWWCGGQLIWQNDWTWAEWFGETGDAEYDNRLVTSLKCSKCGADVMYSEPEPDDE